MFKYYLALAARHALRNKLYSVISVTGLALGLAVLVLAGIYVNDELSYDRWIPESEAIYQVMPTIQGRRVDLTPSDLGLWLDQDYPQLSGVTRVFRRSNQLSHGDLHFNEVIAWVDSNFFEIFDLEVVAGDPELALSQPSSIVITEEIAAKFFADGNAIGQTLILDREHAVQVGAVLRDLPSNSHLRLSILAPGHAAFSPLLEQDNNPVTRYFGTKLWGINTYLKAASTSDAEGVEADLDNLLDRHLPISDGRKNSDIYQLQIMPIESIHLAPSNVSQGDRDLSGILQVLTISAMILLAACINYINLMTARGMKRAPEIATRKTVGASRLDLIRQYLTESLLYVTISFLIAIALCYLLLSPLNAFLNRAIQFGIFSNLPLVLGAGGIVVATILVAGVYPSLTLSRLSPLQAFKSNLGSTGGKLERGAFRHLLAIVQFAILTGLLIATIVIYQQSQYAIGQALNQNEDPIVIISADCEDPLRQQFLQISDVKGVACARQIPQWGVSPTTGLRLRSGEDRSTTVAYTSIDYDFFNLFDLELEAGRNFDENRSSDIIRDESQFDSVTSIVVNEELVRQFEFASTAEAVGQIFSWSRLFQQPSTFSPLHEVEIIGVVQDFQIGNVRRASPATVFYIQRDQSNFLALRIDGQNVTSTLQSIDDAWRGLKPNQPIRRSFFDERTESLYRDITRQAILLTIGAGIAMTIALLGLVGLAAFVAEKRSKEVSIRKILGGSKLDIIKLLLWQFSKPVLISNLVAWPIAFYFLSIWLQGFASHIELNPFVFMASSLTILVVALLTVSAHSFIVASTNPVKSLRYE